MFREIAVHPSRKPLIVCCVLFGLLLFAKIIFFQEFDYFVWSWRFLIILAVLAAGFMHLDRTTKFYTLNALEMTGTEGIFSKHTIRVPLNRITNFEIQRSFIGRLLGMGSLFIDTAGSRDNELKIRQLEERDIVRFVDQLNILLGHQKIAEAGDNRELRNARERTLKTANSKTRQEFSLEEQV